MSDAPPDHILILGSGVFALTTALELLERPSFAQTRLTLVSPTLPADPSSASSAADKSEFPAHATASHDTTRIIRTDYADPTYAELGAVAHSAWRDLSTGWGAEGRYTESGLLLCAESGRNTAAAKYVSEALENAKALERKAGVADAQSRVAEVKGPEQIQKAMRVGPSVAQGTGDIGYLNSGGGWADAGACTDYLLQRVLTHPAAKARLTAHRAAATRLTFSDDDSPRISGATLDRAPHSVAAALTILATGAWTPALLDTRGVASARALPSAYIPLSDAEAAALRAMPVHLNLASGCFVFPPTRTARRPGAAGGAPAWEIKVARHAFGYAPPARRARPVRVDADGEAVHAVAAARVPVFAAALPAADEALLRGFVARALPVLADVGVDGAGGAAAARPWTARLCYYLDTARGDWLVTRHPAFRSSLFVATGDSGHAFKFMPALGRKIVDVLDGTDAREGGAWTRKWRWPTRDTPLKRHESGEVWCHDGSRAGEPGLTLEDALKNAGMATAKSSL